MTAAAQDQKHAITLKGSTDIVAEFFNYGVNSILYQRGIYPEESFTRQQKYGLTLLVTSDDKLNAYLSEVLTQVKHWLTSLTVQKLVVIIKSVETNEVLERWQFNVQCDKSYVESKEGDRSTARKVKSEKEINGEIKAVIRQITATVTFLPLIDTACEFDLLVYTDKDIDVPSTWGESGPQFIANSEEVKLRSFNTMIHKVDTMVAYKPQ
ncbi:mitotic spindle assembly checkpoint protein MAD2A-like [Watersipora subatra]|uniref:mitotic spindle assembly checkpoint protein MAD2A-like n=1 Tax=Watersipora subatra TaxID=2589382 RepID=UPI00355C1AA9